MSSQFLIEHCFEQWKEFRNFCSDFQVYPKFWNMLENSVNSYLQDIKLAAFVILHIKVVDGELNAAPRSSVNVPYTLLAGGIRVRVARAAEGACGPRQLCTTTCENSKAQSVLSEHWPLGRI